MRINKSKDITFYPSTDSNKEIRDKFPELNSTINKLSKKYNITPNAVAVAWILRHPAKMQVVIGTMNKDRISDISKASSITLSREEWYEIYRAAGNTLP